jgi:hypothetical protein
MRNTIMDSVSSEHKPNVSVHYNQLEAVVETLIQQYYSQILELQWDTSQLKSAELL